MLLLQFALEFDVLLLELGDQVLLKLYFLDHLHEVGVGLAGFVGELVSFLLDLELMFNQALKVVLSRFHLLRKFLVLIHLVDELLIDDVVVLLGLEDRGLHHVTLTEEVSNVVLLGVNLLSEILDLSSKGTDTRLSDVLLVDSLSLFLGHAVLLVLQLYIIQVQRLVLLLKHSVLVQLLFKGLVQLIVLGLELVVLVD